MVKVAGLIFLVIWLYVLHVLRRSELPAWRYFWGSGGLFILLLLFVRPYATEPLARLVASVAGFVGDITGIFTSYFKYSVIFIDSKAGSISLLIDFECSGIIEILAYVSLLCFFEAYSRYERVMAGVLGVLYIVMANAIRIISICLIIYFFGMKSYYVAHTFVGRLIFYGLTIMLYFVVFTRTQILRQRVGGFSYGHTKQGS